MDGLNIAPHAAADLRLSCGSMQISASYRNQSLRGDLGEDEDYTGRR